MKTKKKTIAQVVRKLSKTESVELVRSLDDAYTALMMASGASFNRDNELSEEVHELRARVYVLRMEVRKHAR